MVARCVAPLLAGRVAVFQRMQFLARFEAHSLAGGDAYLGTGSRIAADPGLAGAHAEDAKPAQFDALSVGESLFEALENRIHRSFCLAPGKACTLDYMMDDVLLNQWGNLAGATKMTVLRPTDMMLQVLRRL